MNDIDNPPEADEFEAVAIGPGYGESIALHIGNNRWIVVDSCIAPGGKEPGILRYFEILEVDPAEAVDIVVATHWHDDHIGGIAKTLKACSRAKFCCASALKYDEFLTTVGALEDVDDPIPAGSGMREMYHVFETLAEDGDGDRCRFVTADRRILKRDHCELWVLSPADDEYVDFLKTVREHGTTSLKTGRRMVGPRRNDVSVALWLKAEEIVAVLGADLEKQGWIKVLENKERPKDLASLFKVPHHGSASADEPQVWKDMLVSNPLAIVTPWRLAGRQLPTQSDVRRICARTSRAYATSRPSVGDRQVGTRSGVVAQALQDTTRSVRPVSSHSMVRARRKMGSDEKWRIKTFGDACHLREYAEGRGS